MNLPNKKYNIIYADPPWNFNFHKRKKLSEEAKARLYPTMSGEDIKNLPIGDIADDDCILFLWVMNSELPLALEVIKAWGFKYKTIGFFWVKLTKKGKHHFGGGNWTRSNPEICLLATKGDVTRISASVRNLLVTEESEQLFSELREHSRKPDEIRKRIVDLVGNVPRIELFARNNSDGWDCWGNQVDKYNGED